VLVHVLDGGVDSHRPWLPGQRDYLSASILNTRKLPHGLYGGGVALVLSPASRVRCGYPQARARPKLERARPCAAPLCPHPPPCVD